MTLDDLYPGDLAKINGVWGVVVNYECVNRWVPLDWENSGAPNYHPDNEVNFPWHTQEIEDYIYPSRDVPWYFIPKAFYPHQKVHCMDCEKEIEEQSSAFCFKSRIVCVKCHNEDEIDR